LLTRPDHTLLGLNRGVAGAIESVVFTQANRRQNIDGDGYVELGQSPCLSQNVFFQRLKNVAHFDLRAVEI